MSRTFSMKKGAGGELETAGTVRLQGKRLKRTIHSHQYHFR